MKIAKSIIASIIIAGTLALQGTISSAQSGPFPEHNTDETLQPFQVHISDEDLAELKRRIKATRWPPKSTLNKQSGINRI